MKSATYLGFCAALAAHLLCREANAADWYVATNGDGSSGAAWATHERRQ